MLTHNYNLSTLETEAGGRLGIWNLQLAGLGYIVRTYLKRENAYRLEYAVLHNPICMRINGVWY